MLKLSSEPVVNVGDTRRPTFLPPELCFVLPNQRAKQALSSDQAKEMNKLRLQNASNLVNPTEDNIAKKAQALDLNARDMNGPVSMVMTHHVPLLIDFNRNPLALRRRPTC